VDEKSRRGLLSAYLVLTHFLTRAYLAHPWVFVGLLVGVSISNVVFFACSSFSKQVVLRAPACWIVGLQLFRVLLEYCMHLGYVQGAVPQQMTVHGDNFDIVTGVLAFAVALNLDDFTLFSADEEEQEGAPRDEVKEQHSDNITARSGAPTTATSTTCSKRSTSSEADQTERASSEAEGAASTVASTRYGELLHHDTEQEPLKEKKAAEEVDHEETRDNNLFGSPSPASTLNPAQKLVLFIFNMVGLWLLTSVFLTILLSLPTSMRVLKDADGPAAVFFFFAPYEWFPLVALQVALAGHVLSFRQCFVQGKQKERNSSCPSL